MGFGKVPILKGVWKMTDKKNKKEETCDSASCKAELFSGLFNLMDKIEEEDRKKKDSEAKKGEK